jgi:hypothetical protein
MHAYIVYGSIRLLVPQQRHRVPTLILRICLEVHLMQILAAEESIHRRPRILVVRGREFPSRPALGVALGVGPNYGNIDDILQPLQMADEIDAMRKGAK